MSDDLLAREIAALRAGFVRSGNGNVGYLATEIARLMTAGYRLPEIETELRRQDAPVFLLALPLAADAAAEFQIVHPAGLIAVPDPRFYLWIGINGWSEAAEQLAHAGIPAASNLANLDRAGFILRRQAASAQLDPTATAEPPSPPEQSRPDGQPWPEDHARPEDHGWPEEQSAPEEQFSQSAPVQEADETGYLEAYLSAPDLAAARDLLLAAPAWLYGADEAAMQAALHRLAGSDDLWRAGMLEAARERGADAAYLDWRELLAAQDSPDDGAAIAQLTAAVARHHGCLRDRALELLLERYRRTGELDGQRAVATELADHRSAGSPPGRRPLDLANLGLVLVQQGDLDGARTALRDATAMLPSLRDPAWRGLVWLRRGTFARDYDGDPVTALHSFRAAAEEFRAADDQIAAAQALEDLSAVYRAQHQSGLAGVYSQLAEQALEEAEDQQAGIAGDRAAVSYAVQKGCAQADFLSGQFGDAYARAAGLLAEPGPAGSGTERLAVERLAVAAGITTGDRGYVRDTATGWAGQGHGEWLTITRATIRFGELAVRDPGLRVVPDEVPELLTLRTALVRAGVTEPDAARFLGQDGRPADFARNLLHLLAGLPSPDEEPAGRPGQPPTAWRRDAAPAGRRPQPAPAAPLPAEPSWADLIVRYHSLGAWQLPDLALIGPVLDRWALRSRFDGAVRINPAEPVPGSLNVYFWAADPDGQLEPSVPGCAYVPDGELIMCSLHFLDGLVRIDRALADWVLAHEVGHAHFDQDAGSLTAADSAGAQTAESRALEEEADAFFLNGVPGEGLPGLMDAFYRSLSPLYELDYHQQFGEAARPAGQLDHLLPLDQAPDVAGHRPLVFRAVDLIRYLLRTRADLGDISYIEQFAASLTRPGRPR